MAELTPSDESLQTELASLRRELAEIKREKVDLEMLVDIITAHGDNVEKELLNTVASAQESLQDPLTNLYRRNYMEETLTREIIRCRRHSFPLTIIMVGIDNFDMFNQTLSHTVGDIALQELAHILQTSIRREDVACRYDGEEFALVLTQASPTDIKMRAEQIRLKVKQGFRTPYQDDIRGLTISMGIAGYPEHGMNPREILDAAGSALRQARQSGKDRVELAMIAEAS